MSSSDQSGHLQDCWSSCDTRRGCGGSDGIVKCSLVLKQRLRSGLDMSGAIPGCNEIVLFP
jgi:hypothetical protein